MYWYVGVLGLALIVAPYVLGYSNDIAALWSSLILGVIVAGVSLIKALIRGTGDWVYWVSGVAGVLAVIAPYVLGFNVVTAATWTSIVLGVVIALLAAYQLFLARPPRAKTEQRQDQD